MAAVTANRELGQVSFMMRSQSTGGLTARSETGALVQAGQADQTPADCVDGRGRD